MEYKYILLIYILILIIVFINSIIYVNNNLYFRNNLIKINMIKKKNMNCVIYSINQNAGLANTLRGMSSSIILSFFCRSKFYLNGWKSITFYFDYPKLLIYKNQESKQFIYFRSFNKSVIYELKQNNSIIIADIYGFINSVILIFSSTKEMSILKKTYSLQTINYLILNNIIHREIFIPSVAIKKYITVFEKIKENKNVLGIHIRSGNFENNFTENYFSKFIKLKKYFTKSLLIVKKYNISLLFSISDNKNNLKEIEMYYKPILINITFDGEIIHSKYALYNLKINNNAIRIVSEFILLSNCDIIIGTQRSSFSAEACRRLLPKKCFFI